MRVNGATIKETDMVNKNILTIPNIMVDFKMDWSMVVERYNGVTVIPMRDNFFKIKFKVLGHFYGKMVKFIKDNSKII